MKGIWRLAWLLLLIFGIVGVTMTLRTPSDLYTSDGKFAGCPSRPSCVSSQATDDEHRVPQLGFSSDPMLAHALLKEVIQRMNGKIVHERPNYLHAVFVSPIMHFRDDVELLLHPDGTVDVRSVSRFGWWDFGDNRKRVEAIRQQFEAMP